MQPGPFTAMCIGSKIDLLTKIHDTLETARISKREHMLDLINVVFRRCLYSSRPMADDLGIMHSSIEHWIEGRNAPQEALWPSIIEWIKSALAVEISRLNQLLRGEL